MNTPKDLKSVIKELSENPISSPRNTSVRADLSIKLGPIKTPRTGFSKTLLKPNLYLINLELKLSFTTLAIVVLISGISNILPKKRPPRTRIIINVFTK